MGFYKFNFFSCIICFRILKRYAVAGIDLLKLRKYISKIRKSYFAHAYHNFEHACHVLLNAARFLKFSPVDVVEFDGVEIFSTLFSVSGVLEIRIIDSYRDGHLEF